MNTNFSLQPLSPACFSGTETRCPSLVILEQSAPAQESFTKDGGLEKKLFLVIKNSSFKIRLGFDQKDPKLDFHKLSVETVLLFDELNTPVPFVKKQPVTTKGRISTAGSELTLDVKITVLSSHCEGMNFRIQFSVVDPNNRIQLAGSVQTQPIKVLSKPDQLRPKPKPKSSRSSRKRKVSSITKPPENKLVLESLARIEAKQQEILQRVMKPAPLMVDHPVPVCEIQLALVELISAWQRTPVEARPEKIRKIANQSTSKQTDCLAELFGMLRASGLEKELVGSIITPTSSTSIPVEQFDSICKDFLNPISLSDPMSLSDPFLFGN
jgi:hypothetical protein